MTCKCEGDDHGSASYADAARWPRSRRSSLAASPTQAVAQPAPQSGLNGILIRRKAIVGARLRPSALASRTPRASSSSSVAACFGLKNPDDRKSQQAASRRKAGAPSLSAPLCRSRHRRVDLRDSRVRAEICARWRETREANMVAAATLSRRARAGSMASGREPIGLSGAVSGLRPHRIRRVEFLRNPLGSGLPACRRSSTCRVSARMIGEE